mgnify:FL=1
MSLRADLRLQLQQGLADLEEAYRTDAAAEGLRDAAPLEDDDGAPLWPDADGAATPSGGPALGRGVRFPQQRPSPRPTRSEIEARLALLQSLIAQRLPYCEIRDQAALLWGMRSDATLRKYLRVARSRMVEDLVEDRWMHQAEQIYALMDVARRAAEHRQFTAAVGAHRVIAEIGGLLRAPLKPPEGP